MTSGRNICFKVVLYHLAARIDFEADQYGGYDLSFGLDG